MTKPEESAGVQPLTKSPTTGQTSAGGISKVTAKPLDAAVPTDSSKIGASTSSSSQAVIKQDASAEQSTNGGNVNGAGQRGSRVAIGGHRAASATGEPAEHIGGEAGASDSSKNPGKGPDEQGGKGERGWS